ncbi:MAG: hypothetical protein V3T88_02690 [Nitrosomonadaceae bacterium]
MSLIEVTESAIILKQIIEGKRGLPGKDGVTTTVEKVVHVQEEGKPGLTGAAPEHQVRNGEIRFKQPDGTWGLWIEVQRSTGGGGGSEAVRYTPIQAADFKINRSSLILGTNIFGVNFAGDVEIILPSGIDNNIIIVVKDESNNASSNNITITTENQ